MNMILGILPIQTDEVETITVWLDNQPFGTIDSEGLIAISHKYISLEEAKAFVTIAENFQLIYPSLKQKYDTDSKLMSQ